MRFEVGDIEFPEPSRHVFSDYERIGDYYFESEDIIGFGGFPSTHNLIAAYRKGIFPWPMEGLPLPWFCPDPRAILDFNHVRLSRSMLRAVRSSTFRFTIDSSFRDVMVACAEAERGDGNGTWITEEFISSYTSLHQEGLAHSVEVWNQEDDLVGGIYGVDAGGIFCGESMFYREPNASKLGLLFLIDHLKSRGSDWMDIQTMSPHMRKLGAEEITRSEFLRRLADTQARNLVIFD